VIPLRGGHVISKNGLLMFICSIFWNISDYSKYLQNSVSLSFYVVKISLYDYKYKYIKKWGNGVAKVKKYPLIS
jgi:hypothetical protein